MSRSAIRYEPSLDGLRAVAVLAVIVYHLLPRCLPGGFTGVDVFFVISGYLITRIILGQLDDGGFRLGSFYQRRVARIVPALAFVGFATLLAARFVYDSKHRGAAGLAFVMSITSLLNVKLCLQGNYFEASPLSQPFLHCWSLSLEEQFYLLYPFVLRRAWRGGTRTVGVVLAALGAVSLAAGIVATPRLPTAAFYLLPFRAWELLAGGLVGAWVWSGLPGARRSWAVGLRLAGSAGIAVSLTAITESSGFPGWVALVPVVSSAALIAAAAIDPATGAWRWLARDPMVRIGTLSYALYLTHWPVCSLVDYAMFSTSQWQRLPVKLAVIAIATVVLHAVVEAPARFRLLDARTTRSEATMLVMSLVIAIGVGLTLRVRHGLPGATLAAVASGGMVVDPDATGGTVALVGDSMANQYLPMLERVCSRLGCRLVVLSVSGVQPFPNRDNPSPELWERSLAALDDLRPDAIVFSAAWALRSRMDRDAMTAAIVTMKNLSPALVITTEMPVAPGTAKREAICAGSRPPFHEEPAARQRRMLVDGWVTAERTATVEVIDVAGKVVGTGDELRVVDGAGRYVYDDRGHFNEHGAALYESEFEAALRRALGRDGG